MQWEPVSAVSATTRANRDKSLAGNLWLRPYSGLQQNQSNLFLRKGFRQAGHLRCDLRPVQLLLQCTLNKHQTRYAPLTLQPGLKYMSEPLKRVKH